MTKAKTTEKNSSRNSKSLAEYLHRIPTRLSEVKLLIIHILWEAGDDFPREWVASDYLLKQTNQKYFDRRTRELRDQEGLDIETRNVDGKAKYRLRSPNIGDRIARTYLTAGQKSALLVKHQHRCSVCNIDLKNNLAKLQADHKIPLSRGGVADLGNWQTLCVQCNVSKRRICQGCQEDCLSCAWAFPEKYGSLVTIRLKSGVLEKYQEKASKLGRHSQDIIQEILEKYIEGK